MPGLLVALQITSILPTYEEWKLAFASDVFGPFTHKYISVIRVTNVRVSPAWCRHVLHSEDCYCVMALVPLLWTALLLPVDAVLSHHLVCCGNQSCLLAAESPSCWCPLLSDDSDCAQRGCILREVCALTSAGAGLHLHHLCPCSESSFTTATLCGLCGCVGWKENGPCRLPYLNV